MCPPERFVCCELRTSELRTAIAWPCGDERLRRRHTYTYMGGTHTRPLCVIACANYDARTCLIRCTLYNIMSTMRRLRSSLSSSLLARLATLLQTRGEACEPPHSLVAAAACGRLCRMRFYAYNIGANRIPTQCCFVCVAVEKRRAQQQQQPWFCFVGLGLRWFIVVRVSFHCACAW